MAARAQVRSVEAQWWLRALAVFLSPASTFAALRDDSDDAARARQEPLTAVVGLAGIAGILWTHTARRLMNQGDVSEAVVPVIVFFGGAFYAIALYWVLGGFLYAASVGLGSQGSYRRSRHLLGLAMAPLALSLPLLWPLRIAIFGRDLFRTGGDDFGLRDAVFGWLGLGFLAWSVVLLAIGVRAVHGWTWGRAAATVAIAAALPGLLVLAASL